MANLRLHGIEKAYTKDQKTIHGVDLEVRDGELIVFVGPSGCGKSTLLRMIAGLETITAGTLLINEKIMNDTPPAARGLAMVFQSYALYPHLSVAENLGFPLLFSGAKKDEISRRVSDVAEILQLGHVLDRKPAALSGGQRQRVAIGRAIIREPGIFLFDEPLSNLDAALRVQMRIELSRLHQRLGATMIYVTHDQVEAMTLGERIVVFNKGRIEQVGTPLELYKQPANLFVAGFLGTPKMNLLELAVDSAGNSRIGSDTVCLPAGMDHLHGRRVTLGFRPQHIRSVREPSSGQVHGVVTFVEQLGDMAIAYVEIGKDYPPLAIKIENDERLPLANEEMAFDIDWRFANWFDESGINIGNVGSPREGAHTQPLRAPTTL
jgi:multiple sugar transport system ATP-binding protein